VKQKIVREVNRRMAVGAERQIFAHEPQPWLVNTMGKPRPYLSRIAWSSQPPETESDMTALRDRIARRAYEI
jgi:hypothetical protein